MSRLVTETSAGSIPMYSGASVAEAVMIVYGMSPSTTSPSSTPVTVTVCSVVPLSGVKVRLVGETVPSDVVEEERLIVTFFEAI